METLEKFYAEHKTMAIILGVILFPLALLVIGLKIYMSMQVAGAHKDVADAIEKDKKFEAQENQLKQEAAQHMAEADTAAQRIEDRKTEEPDMDWQTKRKD